ncbi:hypothetical protein QBC34DRAFT_389036 [Podospora aff. communis PSN243]|uniref:Peroxin 26 n=1 Tax=Podospora aff. communis PSN243 TaxID=3040156 RepID=A0AAV9H9D9_9PEZI|nr:hypothetical protein QBC34DRAFT_389036 [Podospora aff. communis PSN243]
MAPHFERTSPTTYTALGSPTITTTTNGFNSSQQQHNGIMASSISSLSSSMASARHSSSSSHITKTYRQASTLFLTRRLPEALSTVLPLITPPPSDDPNGTAFEPAPVARTSRSTRIKVWSLYLTILNAILELDADEGKTAFGTQEWRGICTKVREGEVWEEVVKHGYHGVEGDVDADVVINLATLLLAHAKVQTQNQKRLENYLAAARTPNLDISDRFSESSPRRFRSPAKGASGADTPRDLNARVKILELYTLHVLVRNDEWDYAREFITVSAVLDEERREAFLQALQSLRDEQLEAEKREKEERQRQEEAIRKDIEEARRLRAENEERERKRLEEERAKRQAASEVDYGIEKTPSQAGSSGRGKKATSSLSRPVPTRKSKAVAPPPSFTTRATMVLINIKALIDQLAVNYQTNPYLLYRTAAFIIGLLLMFSRKSIREKISRILGSGWQKVRATAGMGVKVSYI